jgi:sugar lactone lactonase YvrE
MCRDVRVVFVIGILLAGCSRGPTALPTSAVTPQQSDASPGRAARTAGGSGSFIYVSNQGRSASSPSAVLIYPVGSNGDVAPSSAISGLNTGITTPNGIVVDASGAIFVVDTGTNSILGFPPGAAGNVSPIVVISGSNTGLSVPIGLAIDPTGNLYVDDWGPPASVEEFAAGANGNTAPIRNISGRRTKLSAHLNGIALNSHGDVYVALAGPNSINIFGPTQNGDAKPRRLIAGSETEINGPDGIAVSADGIYLADTGGPYIERFKGHADGNVIPLSLLQTPPASTQALGGLYAATDGTLYVAGYGNAALYQYAAKAKRHDAPLSAISGPTTQLTLPTFVYVK